MKLKLPDIRIYTTQVWYIAWSEKAQKVITFSDSIVLYQNTLPIMSAYDIMVYKFNTYNNQWTGTWAYFEHFYDFEIHVVRQIYEKSCVIFINLLPVSGEG